MGSAKNIVIIGGGVAGLAAGGFLARQGLSVKLFEANHKLGGCCGTTTLDGYTFNDGALYLVMPRLLESVFERLGLDLSTSLPLRKITAPYTATLPDGTVVSLADGPGIDIRKPDGKVDRADIQRGLDRMMARWEPVLHLLVNDLLLHPFSTWRMAVRGWRHLPKFRGTLVSELRSLFSDEAVCSALAGTLAYTGLPPDKLPALQMVAPVAMLSDGFFLPEGGMGQIPAVLGQALRDNGGEIVLGSKIAKIVLKDGRVSGVELEAGDFIQADVVVSTVGGMQTFDGLIAPDDAPASMRRKLRSSPLSHTAFSLQLGLANRVETPSYLNDLIPMMANQRQIFDFQEGEMKWLNYSVPTLTLPELAPEGGSIVEMYPSIPRALALEDWTERMKDRISAAAIDALARRHELDIVVCRARSPRDFQQDMHLYRGAVYGLSPTASPLAMFPHISPIAGCYLAGQTTYPGFGVASAAVSGILAAEAVLQS